VTDRRAALAKVDPVIAELIWRETERQEHGLELIASENFVRSPCWRRWVVR